MSVQPRLFPACVPYFSHNTERTCRRTPSASGGKAGRKLRWFFVFCLYYLAFQIGVTLLRVGFDLDYLIEAVQSAIGMAGTLWFSLERLVIPLAVIVLVTGWRVILSRWRDIAYLSAGVVLLQVGFSFTRNMIPIVVPYYADPALADLDRWLHFGTDPWRWFYGAGGALFPVDLALSIYIGLWSTLAIAFPVLLALADGSAERKRRFLILFLFCFLGIGTVLATGFASVGPIFYDRLLGGDRFAELVAAHSAAGYDASGFGLTQEFLWKAYIGNNALGGGMSAFPSVHLAVATLMAIYLAERSLWLLPVGVLFVAAILVISVGSGYHYAVDGYASILLVLGAWGVLRRGIRRSPVWSSQPAADGCIAD